MRRTCNQMWHLQLATDDLHRMTERRPSRSSICMHGSQEMYLTEGFGIIDDEHLNSLQIKEQKLLEMRERKNKSKKQKAEMHPQSLSKKATWMPARTDVNKASHKLSAKRAEEWNGEGGRLILPTTSTYRERDTGRHLQLCLDLRLSWHMQWRAQKNLHCIYTDAWTGQLLMIIIIIGSSMIMMRSKQLLTWQFVICAKQAWDSVCHSFWYLEFLSSRILFVTALLASPAITCCLLQMLLLLLTMTAFRLQNYLKYFIKCSQLFVSRLAGY